MDVAVLLYFGGGTVLFFFWIYGIVSFVRDVRHRFVPAVRQYRRGRQREQAEAERQEEREQKEQQLY